MINYQATGLCSNCCAEVDTEKMRYCPACGLFLEVYRWYLIHFGQEAGAADYFTIEEAQDAQLET